MWKNPIFQERKKNVKKPYFSGEKKMSKNPSKKKIFTAKFIVKKIRKIFTAKFIVKKKNLKKNLKIFSSKKWLKIFEKKVPFRKSKYLIFQEVKKKRAERDTTEKKISKNPIFQERQKKRDTTEFFCTFGKFFFFISWNIKYFACVTLQSFFGHFFWKIHDFL